MWRTRRIAREVLRVASRRSSGPRTLVDRAEHLAAAAASVPRASTGGIWSLRRGGRHVCREEGSLGPSRVSHRAFSDSSAGDPRGACWSCGGGTSRSDLFFCGGCGAVLPALDDEDDDASDAHLLFRVLGVDPPRFALTNDELEVAMKTLQKTLHPDKFSTAPTNAKTHSADQASLVNRAYATLRDPLKRAKYMLRAAGAGVAEESGMGDEQGAGTGQGLIDPVLLMEVMETREAIEDAGEDVVRLTELNESNDEAESVCVKSIGVAMDANDLDAARKETVRLTYLSRIRDEIKRRLPPG
jgi:molecular chaperone HscB